MMKLLKWIKSLFKRAKSPTSMEYTYYSHKASKEELEQNATNAMHVLFMISSIC